MKIKFHNQLLADLYNNKKVNDKKYKSNPVLVKQYIKTVHKLEDILQFEDIYHIRSLSYEKLIGNRLGYSSVRINHQFRLIFTEIISDNQPYEVNILALEEISKHYE